MGVYIVYSTLTVALVDYCLICIKAGFHGFLQNFPKWPHKLVDLQFLLLLSYKVKNNLLIDPIFIQPTFEGINRISLYHIIRQTVPNINDPVTKRIFPYIISTHVLSQFKFIALGTTNRVKM